MDAEALRYLSQQRTGCLAVLVGGQPHTATIHFSHDEKSNPVRIFIQTAKDSKKCEGLTEGSATPASFTTGFSEAEWQTLQMDGTIRYLRPDEQSDFEQIHYTKNPEAKKYAGPETAFLVFEPHWWRFSDYNTRPPRILSS